MDVPSPIDFSRTEEAEAWAETANRKRPWRKEFFAAIAEALRGLQRPSMAVLELGSGPGYLAEVVLRALPDARYTLLDSSPAMQSLARARVGSTAGAQFVTADFRTSGWADSLGVFDAVVSVQAVHELRHKRHAVLLHQTVYRLLQPDGSYLVCDHVLGPDGMSNGELYMTISEQEDALEIAGFRDVSVLLEKAGLVLHRARMTTR
jgi:cyclopropane fatty-acyl-phospholipid synthase-like methyltransferase